MKYILPLAVFLVVMTLPYFLKEFPSLPSRVMYVSDIVIGLVASVCIVQLIATQRIFRLPFKYLLVFFGFSYVVFCGTLLNQVSPDVTFAGLRFYFKYVPLFLLPFAYDYSRHDTNKLLMVLLAVALIQLPIALAQKFIDVAPNHIGTGDGVTGTLKLSTSLCIFEVSTILMLVAFHLGGRISMSRTAGLCLIAVIPTAISETKVTPILLIVGLAVILFTKRTQMAAKHVTVVMGLATLLGIGFVGIYDQLYGNSGASDGYIDRMTSKSRVLDHYNLKGARAEGFTAFSKRPDLVAAPVRLLSADSPAVGRLDSLKMPFDVLASERPLLLIFGLGVGNVVSTFGEREYANIEERLNAQATTMTILIWECGVLGALFFLAFLALALKDAVLLSKQQQWDDVGAGWASVCAITVVLCVYTNLFGLPEVLAPFCFFAGLVAAKAVDGRRRAFLLQTTASPTSR